MKGSTSLTENDVSKHSVDSLRNDSESDSDDHDNVSQSSSHSHHDIEDVSTPFRHLGM